MSSRQSEELLSPPWEVLLLVSHQLDHKTLAMASCVCKSWHGCMSSDHIWKSICLSQYPSVSTLRSIDPKVSYLRLYTLAHVSSKLRHRNPSKPRLSLDHLIFNIDVFDVSSHLFSIARAGEDLGYDGNGMFRFDITGVDSVTLERSEGLKVTWSVMLKGLRGVFFMMDSKGKGRIVGGAEGWFSEELPSPGCCSSGVTSGLVADLVLGFGSGGRGGDGRMRVEKMSMGMLSVVNWRYVSADDGLRYLQHFLLPSFDDV